MENAKKKVCFIIFFFKEMSTEGGLIKLQGAVKS